MMRKKRMGLRSKGEERWRLLLISVISIILALNLCCSCALTLSEVYAAEGEYVSGTPTYFRYYSKAFIDKYYDGDYGSYTSARHVNSAGEYLICTNIGKPFIAGYKEVTLDPVRAGMLTESQLAYIALGGYWIDQNLPASINGIPRDAVKATYAWHVLEGFNDFYLVNGGFLGRIENNLSHVAVDNQTLVGYFAKAHDFAEENKAKYGYRAKGYLDVSGGQNTLLVTEVKPLTGTLTLKKTGKGPRGLAGELTVDDSLAGDLPIDDSLAGELTVDDSLAGNLSINYSLAGDLPINYSLEGGVYEVYSDSSLSPESKAGSLVTLPSGMSGPLTLVAGTYFIKEIKPPRGYKLDPNIYTVAVEANKDAVINSEDEEKYHTMEALLKKVKADGTDEGLSIAGAKYKVDLYDTTGEDATGLLPIRSWIFKTDEDGIVKLSEDYLESGDELFFDGEGNAIAPLGLYGIEEIEAPEGFERNEGITFCKVTDDGTDVNLTMYNAPTFTEHQLPDIRTKALFYDGNKNHLPEGTVTAVDQIYYEHMQPGHPYKAVAKVYNEATGELLAEGEYTWTPEESEGMVEVGDLTIDMEVFKDGGSIYIDETIYRTDREDGEPVAYHPGKDNPDQTLYIPGIVTRAAEITEEEDYDEERVVLRDEIAVWNLSPGTEYEIRGILMDKKTLEPIRDSQGTPVTAQRTFAPDERNMDTHLDFTASVATLENKTVVIYESLFEAGKLIASHSDPDNKDQTVYIPPRETPPVPATGDEGKTPLYIALGGFTLALMLALFANRQNRTRNIQKY